MVNDINKATNATASSPSAASKTLALTTSPPESELVVVIDVFGGCFNGVYANAPIRLVMVGWKEPVRPLDDEHEPVEIDGERAFVNEYSVGPDDGIDDKVAQALIAADVDVPGLLDLAVNDEAELRKAND